MARNLDAATQAALIAAQIYPVWFVRLDIQADPVYVSSAYGSYTFAGGMGYDAAIVGYTFLGLGNIGQIDPITDDISGSQTLNLTLPGVDITKDYLHQLVNNADLWQKYPAYIWLCTFDSNNNLLGKPVRVKKARMDKLTITIDPDNGTGTIVVSLESQSNYNNEALFSRYSDQQQIDPTDISQIYVADLANKVPQIGKADSGVSGVSKSTLPTGTAIIGGKSYRTSQY